MDHKEIIVRKAPFLFLKWLVAIEFFFALLPFLVVALFNLSQSYETSPIAQTVPYGPLLVIGMIILQNLVITISFVAWCFPVYKIDQQQILLRRSSDQWTETVYIRTGNTRRPLSVSRATRYTQDRFGYRDRR